ncbi:uncharacterized protein [Littorina saxatilis]|uniref:Asl1-like glycosyl hydrolase catalytic domain-containing protein n=1 Tax=Littorina saxatilis TaxID=31220 RepID=A0AAN9BRR6_9CAEN
MKVTVSVSLLLLLTVSVEGRSQKKGLAVPSESYRCGDFDVLHGVAWWYDWAQTPNYHSGCHRQLLANRVPMVWGWGAGVHVPNDAHYVLGFNEPNFHAQSNMSPQDAARHWRELQQQTGNKVLVSPAAAPCGDHNMCYSNGVDWFAQFFQACPDCKVDYLATHGYWCDANIMMHYLEDLWNRFHKKIWLTEFSCPQKHSVSDQLNYMKAVLPRLEAASYVYRYSWFATRFRGDGWIPREASLLEQDSSTLTELGRYYMNF